MIGAAFDTWMMVPDWVRGRSTPEATGVEIAWIADHIDHICQLAGNARHCGIGSDLDGGYGFEQTPRDLRSIADDIGKTVAQLVINWTIDQPGITAALCGAKRAYQIEESAGAMSWQIDNQTRQRVEKALERRGTPITKPAV